MEAVFLKLLNMSLTASVLVVAVLPLRALLKKAPRWSICLLWGLVALRLICPYTPESNLSLIRSSEPITHEILSLEAAPEAETAIPEQGSLGEVSSGPDVRSGALDHAEQVPQQVKPDILTIGGYVWLAGTGVMLLYALFSYWRLKRLVSAATRLEGNIRQSEYVTSPFVLGVLRPIIYLPYGIKQPHIDHILAHERTHIRRGDHLIKPLGFVILSVHWFNPLIWVAYILLCRDIEAACDERVIKEMTKEQRQSYSATLLRCSVHRRRITACPVAFGETGVKQRIKGIMSYKKPVLWVVIVALLAGSAIGVCLLTERPEEPSVTEPTEPVLSNREKMDALLDTLVDHEDTGIASNPESCIMLNREAYQELLSYDELALSYFIPRLRKADIHSYREHMMVRVCADLTGVAGDEVRTLGDWYMIPQLWIAEYDRSVSAPHSERRLQPGIYQPGSAYYNEKYCELNEDGYNEALYREYVDITYYVTADSLVTVYPHRGHKKDYTHSSYDIVRRTVAWEWQSPDPTSPLYTDLARQAQKAIQNSVDFIQDSEIKQLLLSEDCLFQPLKYGNCIARCGDRVFHLSGAGSGTLLAQVRCITELYG